MALMSPMESAAQGVDVGVTGVGLISIQPGDDTVSSPYVGGGLGELGPGFGVGLSAITSAGFVVAAEFSTALFEGVVYGRLISGSGPDEGRRRTARLNDALLIGLAGYTMSSGKTRVLLLGGGGAVLNGVTLDDAPGTISPRRVIAVGVDVLRSVNQRVSLVFGGRYAIADRNESVIISPHVFRIAAGIRVRLRGEEHAE